MSNYRGTNRIILKPSKGYAIMFLYDIKGNIIQRTRISLESVSKVSQYRWSLDRYHNYVFNHKVGRLHRFLLGVTDKNISVDHINGDTLDNRMSNLRVCTHQQNMYNRKVPCTNTSGHVGVSRTPNGNWRARLKVEGKEMCKHFTTKEEAIEWRESMTDKYHKEFKSKH